MKTYGIIQQGQIVRPFIQEESRRRWLGSIKDGTQVVEELKKFHPSKTHKQVKLIFGNMIENTIVQANDLGIDVSDFLKYLLDDRIPKGQGLTKDFLHEIMYVICPTTDEDGKRTTLSKMDSEQASNLYERFRNIVAPLGIDIPDADINWREKH